MELKQANYSDIRKAYKLTKLQQLVDDFAKSGMACAEVCGFANKTAFGCAQSLNHAIQRTKQYNIKAISRCDKVYLLNKILIKEME